MVDDSIEVENKLAYGKRRHFVLPPTLDVYTSTVSGSAANTNDAGRINLSTGATSASIGRIFAGNVDIRRGRKFEAHFGLLIGASVAAIEIEVGINSADAASLSPATEHKASFVLNSAANAKWLCRTSDGATATETVTSETVAVSTFYVLSIISDEVDVKFLINGVVVAVHTTNLPGTTTDMSPRCYIKNTAAADKDIYAFVIEAWEDVS